MIQKNFEEVKCIFEKNINELVQKYGIKLLYVFGSYAKGSNNKNSDIDIAVLVDDNYKPMYKLNMIGDLTSIFKRDDIDLVILNGASPVLRHQVIKYGKIIYEESLEEKVIFEAKVLSVYMDMEPFRRTQMEFINERLSENY
ncbi:MAG TPA: nucleotidyltransferase domain-containing protein [Clostridiaceae bacterium]|nr:nucleotidyltransferase domain-containing protein [Clostridiaceae bacterium]HBF76592.1 nucleotidyltransferase domain-containing protein [Clostridiaceae bacterium]